MLSSDISQFLNLEFSTSSIKAEEGVQKQNKKLDALAAGAKNATVENLQTMYNRTFGLEPNAKAGEKFAQRIKKIPENLAKKKNKGISVDNSNDIYVTSQKYRSLVQNLNQVADYITLLRELTGMSIGINARSGAIVFLQGNNALLASSWKPIKQLTRILRKTASNQKKTIRQNAEAAHPADPQTQTYTPAYYAFIKDSINNDKDLYKLTRIAIPLCKTLEMIDGLSSRTLSAFQSKYSKIQDWNRFQALKTARSAKSVASQLLADAIIQNAVKPDGFRVNEIWDYKSRKLAEKQVKTIEEVQVQIAKRPPPKSADAIVSNMMASKEATQFNAKDYIYGGVDLWQTGKLNDPEIQRIIGITTELSSADKLARNQQRLNKIAKSQNLFSFGQKTVKSVRSQGGRIGLISNATLQNKATIRRLGAEKIKQIQEKLKAKQISPATAQRQIQAVKMDMVMNEAPSESLQQSSLAQNIQVKLEDIQPAQVSLPDAIVAIMQKAGGRYQFLDSVLQTNEAQALLGQYTGAQIRQAAISTGFQFPENEIAKLASKGSDAMQGN